MPAVSKQALSEWVTDGVDGNGDSDGDNNSCTRGKVNVLNWVKSSRQWEVTDGA